MATEKQLKTRIRKLFQDADANTINTLIQQVQEELREEARYDEVFANDATAVKWFLNFCKENGLKAYRVRILNTETGKLVPYGRYKVKGMEDNYKPYFTLWVHKGHQNDDQEPHLEIGESLEKLWLPQFNLAKLEHQMRKVIWMHKKMNMEEGK